MRIIIATLLCCFVLAGAAIFSASAPNAGAIELRDEQHMREFLAQQSPFGIRVDGGPALVLTFYEDDTCLADGLRGPGVVPQDSTLPWINLPRQRFGLSPESFDFLDAIFPEIPSGERLQRRAGTWSVTTDRITFELDPVELTPPTEHDISIPNDQHVQRAVNFPLAWADGKLRITIGGIDLKKVDWPSKLRTNSDQTTE